MQINSLHVLDLMSTNTRLDIYRAVIRLAQVTGDHLETCRAPDSMTESKVVPHAEDDSHLVLKYHEPEKCLY